MHRYANFATKQKLERDTTPTQLGAYLTELIFRQHLRCVSAARELPLQAL